MKDHQYTELELLLALRHCKNYRDLCYFRRAYMAVYRQLPLSTHIAVATCYDWKFKHLTQSIN